MKVSIATNGTNQEHALPNIVAQRKSQSHFFYILPEAYNTNLLMRTLRVIQNVDIL